MSRQNSLEVQLDIETLMYSVIQASKEVFVRGLRDLERDYKNTLENGEDSQAWLLKV